MHGDACDNCKTVRNDNQANCNSIEEGDQVAQGNQVAVLGDACDPVPCATMSILAGSLSSAGKAINGISYSPNVLPRAPSRGRLGYPALQGTYPTKVHASREFRDLPGRAEPTRGAHPATGATLSRDGNRVAIAGDGVCLWDVATNTLVRRIAVSTHGEGRGAQLAFGPEGRTLAVTGPSGGEVFDTHTGAMVTSGPASLTVGTRSAADASVLRQGPFASSPDGRHEVVGGQRLCVWSLDEPRRCPLETPVAAVAWGPHLIAYWMVAKGRGVQLIRPDDLR